MAAGAIHLDRNSVDDQYDLAAPDTVAMGHIYRAGRSAAVLVLEANSKKESQLDPPGAPSLSRPLRQGGVSSGTYSLL